MARYSLNLPAKQKQQGEAIAKRQEVSFSLWAVADTSAEEWRGQVRWLSRWR